MLEGRGDRASTNNPRRTSLRGSIAPLDQNGLAAAMVALAILVPSADMLAVPASAILAALAAARALAMVAAAVPMSFTLRQVVGTAMLLTAAVRAALGSLMMLRRTRGSALAVLASGAVVMTGVVPLPMVGRRVVAAVMMPLAAVLTGPGMPGMRPLVVAPALLVLRSGALAALVRCAAFRLALALGGTGDLPPFTMLCVFVLRGRRVLARAAGLALARFMTGTRVCGFSTAFALAPTALFVLRCRGLLTARVFAVRARLGTGPLLPPTLPRLFLRGWPARLAAFFRLRLRLGSRAFPSPLISTTSSFFALFGRSRLLGVVVIPTKRQQAVHRAVSRCTVNPTENAGIPPQPVAHGVRGGRARCAGQKAQHK